MTALLCPWEKHITLKFSCLVALRVTETTCASSTSNTEEHPSTKLLHYNHRKISRNRRIKKATYSVVLLKVYETFLV